VRGLTEFKKGVHRFVKDARERSHAQVVTLPISELQHSPTKPIYCDCRDRGADNGVTDSTEEPILV